MLASLHVTRITHSLKTGFACLIGYLLTRVVNFPVDQWLVITIIVVMCAQLNVGSVIQKSYMRFFGTISGSLLAASTLYFFGNHPLVIGVMLTLSAFIFSYLATSKNQFSDAGTLGAVTTTIILMNPDASLSSALQRCAEICLGLLIAALVTQFVFPLHARGRLRKMQAQTLSQFSKYYRITLLESVSEEKFLSLDEEIVKSLAEQRALAKDSKREPLGKTFDPQQFSQNLHSEKEIFRAMVCLRYARDSFPQDKILLLQEPLILRFHQNICRLLDELSLVLSDEKNPKISNVIAIDELKHYIEMLPASTDERIYYNGFIFCAELLAKQLNLLAALITLP
jgi:uncharacterized membrane protein YgaE (UPF0421/DUF939 family)